ncbi:uncharacterized protein LOC143471190 isoform X2 [Clavelina lepadiformis]|uniref:uncharacterized protein LOC143471190 isoform X2 n=1 Tax=Clavelina lepadiformis TaxID=159417 RepID=UPI004042819C
MASSDSEEAESILINLNKTRQLWSSKAELGTADYLIPKSPVSQTSTHARMANGTVQTEKEPANIEVVKSDDQVVEDYELPDIQAMRSQWEIPKSKRKPIVPLPSTKSPAVIAREKSQKRQTDENLEPVNRVETPNEEPYEVELNKLKEQFESAAKATSSNKSTSNQKSPVSKAAIKEHVSRTAISKKKPARNVNKKIRFEVEGPINTTEIDTPEHRVETENLAVNLTDLKSQFESRKDEHLVTPDLTKTHRKSLRDSSHQSLIQVATPSDSSSPEVVRPDDTDNQVEHYEVELGELKKRFEQDRAVSNRIKLPVSLPQKRLSPTKDTTSCEDNDASPKVETVRSSEAVYDEMIGEESVKDRLQRYKSMTESDRPTQVTVTRQVSQKRPVSPAVRKESEKVDSVGNTKTDHSSIEVVKSPPAGTKVTPEYVPSVDLRQTKALFEVSDAKPPALYKKRHSTDPTIPQSPSRTGRRSVSGSQSSRSPSNHSGVSSPSPSGSRSKSPAVVESLGSDFNPESEETMSEVVRPPPAGTKETPTYVPAVKVSSMKSMFEQPKSATSPTSSDDAPRRRQLRKADWANVKTVSEKKAVPEGSYEDRQGVVRPHTAGTKERPSYNLSSDFLKSRAAIFDAPSPKQYSPRNTIKSDAPNHTAEVVSERDQASDLDYTPSTSLTDAKKRFEDGQPASAEQQDPQKLKDDLEVVPAADLQSARNVFEAKPDEEKEPAPRKEQIDIAQEANEAKQRDQEVIQAKEQEEEAVQEEEEQEQEEEQSQQQDEPEQPDEVKETNNEPDEDDKDVEEQTPKVSDKEVKQIEETHEENSRQEDSDQAAEEETPEKGESDSETEGEYLLENNKQLSDEEAAGVTPVRVAVSDSPPPEVEPVELVEEVDNVQGEATEDGEDKKEVVLPEQVECSKDDSPANENGVENIAIKEKQKDLLEATQNGDANFSEEATADGHNYLE